MIKVKPGDVREVSKAQQLSEPTVSRNKGLWSVVFPLDGLSGTGTQARDPTLESQSISSLHEGAAAPEARPPPGALYG